jgi:hypothetical protein
MFYVASSHTFLIWYDKLIIFIRWLYKIIFTVSTFSFNSTFSPPSVKKYHNMDRIYMMVMGHSSVLLPKLVYQPHIDLAVEVEPLLLISTWISIYIIKIKLFKRLQYPTIIILCFSYSSRKIRNWSHSNTLTVGWKLH